MADGLGIISNAQLSKSLISSENEIKIWGLCGESDEIGEKKHQIESSGRGKRTREMKDKKKKKSHQT